MLFKLSAAALLVLGVTNVLAAHLPEVTKSAHAIHHWNAYKAKHSKHYEDPKEDKERMLLFLAAKEKVRRHNEAHARGEVSFKMALNHLSDYTEAEYKQLNGFKENEVDREKIPVWTPSNETIVANDFSYSKAYYYTPVKNQGQCGSCWTFSVTGALEAQMARMTGNVDSLSEQNLLDCVTENHGCDGGNPLAAFEYVKNNRGIDTEDVYPYEGNQGKCSSFDWLPGIDKIYMTLDYKLIPKGNEEYLRLVLDYIGPVAVVIDASHDSFKHYSGGLYEEPDCSPDNMSHAVLVIGYGTDSDVGDYWIVKNSWGDHWGMDGYFWMPRNRDNYCGIASYAAVLTVTPL